MKRRERRLLRRHAEHDVDKILAVREYVLRELNDQADTEALHVLHEIEKLLED